MSISLPIMYVAGKNMLFQDIFLFCKEYMKTHIKLLLGCIRQPKVLSYLT
jgi:hypothetical protein